MVRNTGTCAETTSLNFRSPLSTGAVPLLTDGCNGWKQNSNNASTHICHYSQPFASINYTSSSALDIQQIWDLAVVLAAIRKCDEAPLKCRGTSGLVLFCICVSFLTFHSCHERSRHQSSTVRIPLNYYYLISLCLIWMRHD